MNVSVYLYISSWVFSLSISSRYDELFFVAELKNLVHTLQNSSESVKPMLFLNSVFSAFPRFAEVSEHGGFVQQVKCLSHNNM